MNSSSWMSPSKKSVLVFVLMSLILIIRTTKGFQVSNKSVERNNRKHIVSAPLSQNNYKTIMNSAEQKRDSHLMLLKLPKSLFLRLGQYRSSLATPGSTRMSMSVSGENNFNYDSTGTGLTTPRAATGDSNHTSGSAISSAFSADLHPHLLNACTETEDFSLQNLQHRMHAFVQRHKHNCRLAVALAGGGGHFLSTLTSTPGASSVLLEGCITYDRESYRQYVQQNLNASTFRYSSQKSADMASQVAVRRAIKLAAAADPTYRGHGPLDGLRNAVGVACASALQSPSSPASQNRNKKKHQHLGSRAFVTVTKSCCAQDDPIRMKVNLAVPLSIAGNETQKPNNDCNSKKYSIAANRSRFEEDVFTSHCILSCLEYALAHNAEDEVLVEATNSNNSCGKFSSESSIAKQALATKITRQPNELVLERWTPSGDEVVTHLPTSLASLSFPIKTAMRSLSTSTSPKMSKARASKTTMAREQIDLIKKASERILSGHDQVVALLPDSNTNDDGNSLGFRCLSNTLCVLPPCSIIFPGSFNPPHKGHIELVRAAMETTNCEVAWFELSITNADKPSLQIDQIVERVSRFLSLQQQPLKGKNGTGMFPKQWGILLTDAPLFVQKANLLHPMQVSRSFLSTLPTSPQQQKAAEFPNLHFVIGTDTLVRLVDKKYYDNSEEKMIQTLSSMPCRFVVGGRLEQSKVTANDASKSSLSAANTRFITGQKEVKALPGQLQSKFVLLKEFRVDISSTELRKHISKGQQ